MSFDYMEYESKADINLSPKPIDPGFSKYQEGQYGKLEITYLNNPINENGDLYDGFLSANPKIAYKFENATKCQPVVSQMTLNDELVTSSTKTTSGTQFFDYTAFLSTDCLEELTAMEDIYLSYSLRFTTNESFFNQTIFDVTNKLIADDSSSDLRLKNLKLDENYFHGSLFQRDYYFTVFDWWTDVSFVAINGREKLWYELNEDFLSNGIWNSVGSFIISTGELLTKNPLTVKSLKIDLPFYKNDSVSVDTVFTPLDLVYETREKSPYRYEVELFINDSTYYDLESSELKTGENSAFFPKPGILLANKSLLQNGFFELVVELENASGITEEFKITKQINLERTSFFDLIEITEKTSESHEDFVHKYLFDENQILINSHKNLSWEDFLKYESEAS